LFAIVSAILTLTRQTRPALPFLLGLFLFVVGISGIALIVFPDIVPFSVTLWGGSIIVDKPDVRARRCRLRHANRPRVFRICVLDFPGQDT